MQTDNNEHLPSPSNSALLRPATRRSPFARYGIVVAALVVLVAIVFLLGIYPRMSATAALKRETAELSVPTVTVMHPKVGNPDHELILPGNMQAFMDTPIYARTNGYLRRWTADIGARVKAGQLLAELDTPEVDDQLQQARADLATADANHRLAQKTATRWQELVKSDSVSKQEADQTLSDMEAKKAALDSARFNVSRLEKMQAFKRIYAPFEGVVTARRTDVGALVDSGSGVGKELFHIAATQTLRVYVSVPQAYSRDMVPGVEANLTLAEFPGRTFKGKLARTTQSIDQTSRTLLAEIAVDNPKGELLPGSYAQVHLKLHSGNPVLMLPVNTLIFRSEGVQVAVVGANQRIVLKQPQLGRDFGTEVEVMSGVDAGDAVVVNPSDSLLPNTEVRVAKDAPAAKPKS
ncbi:MAG: efflux RND transporter periplasmic adaptor subunit [Betaproteobacteria bacterium]